MSSSHELHKEGNATRLKGQRQGPTIAVWGLFGSDHGGLLSRKKLFGVVIKGFFKLVRKSFGVS